jgi:ATP-dependent DNA helicase RecG
MIDSCGSVGLPKPEFQEVSGGFMVTLRKDIFDEGYFNKFGLNDRQLKACTYITEKGGITNREYREINRIKPRLASNELKDMVEKKVLERLGTTGRGTYYVLRKRHKLR